MTARSRAVTFALFTGVVALAPSRARADDDPRKKAAETTFQEGVRLQAQGKSEEALVKLKKAYEMYPSPNTLGGIARVEQALGRNLEAVRHYREALRNPLMHPENADHARGAVKELEKDLARINVKGPKGLVVVIDGSEIVLPMAEPLDVKAQTFELEGSLGGTKYTARTTAPIGRTTDIEMVAQTAAPATTGAPIPPPVAAADRVEPPPADPSRSFWTTRHTTGVVVGGLAVVAAGVGSVFLGVRQGHVSDGKDVLAANPRPCAQPSDAACGKYDDARNGIKSSELAAGVSFGAFVALGVTAAVLILWPEPKREAKLRVLPIGRDLSLLGTF